MMIHFGIDSGDGQLGKSEYILLCAMRLGVLSSSLIECINDRFDELDADHSGKFSITCESDNSLRIPPYIFIRHFR